MSNINTLLEEIGLTKKECEVYLVLLKLGSVPAGPLIKEMGMYRAEVYNLLDRLIDKGVVHYVIQADRRYFEAEDPKRLIEYIESKEEALRDKKKELQMMLPELMLKRSLSKDSQEGTLYKGMKGMKSIFEDILNYDTDFLVLGASGQFKKLFGAYYIHWHERRRKEGMKQKIIYSETMRKEKREKEFKLREIRYLPNKSIGPATTFIYGDKVAIILWSEVPIAFVMRSKSVGDSYRNYFDIIWKTAKE